MSKYSCQKDSGIKLVIRSLVLYEMSQRKGSLRMYFVTRRWTASTCFSRPTAWEDHTWEA